MARKGSSRSPDFKFVEDIGDGSTDDRELMDPVVTIAMRRHDTEVDGALELGSNLGVNLWEDR